MLESVDKLMTAGLGALNMTRKKAEDIFEDLVRQGQAQKGRRTGFVKDALDAADKTRRNLEDLVAKQVHQALSKVDLPSKQDVARLEKKLDQLLKQMKSRP